MKFKAELTIPTEQYGNIRPTVEGTPEEIVQAYRDFSALTKPREGLSSKEFNQALDRYLSEGTGDAEVYIAMSQEQQGVIQEIKKAFKRIGKDLPK